LSRGLKWKRPDLKPNRNINTYHREPNLTPRHPRVKDDPSYFSALSGIVGRLVGGEARCIPANQPSSRASGMVAAVLTDITASLGTVSVWRGRRWPSA